MEGKDENNVGHPTLNPQIDEQTTTTYAIIEDVGQVIEGSLADAVQEAVGSFPFQNCCTGKLYCILAIYEIPCLSSEDCDSF